MSQLPTSAAYVRKEKFADPSKLRAAGIGNSLIGERVWELLVIPQTVVSLQRAATQDAGQSETDCPTQPSRSHVEDILGRLLDAELIEVSPDS